MRTLTAGEWQAATDPLNRPDGLTKIARTCGGVTRLDAQLLGAVGVVRWP